MPRIYSAPYYAESEIESLDDNQIQYPYNDTYMRYDGIKRQYIPTEELLNKYGIRIEILTGIRGSIDKELEYISDQVYACMDKNSGSNIETLKFIVAKGYRRGLSPYRFRLEFQDILRKQAEYYVLNGDPTKLSGLDLEHSQGMNKGMLINEDRNIDPNVKIRLMDLGLMWPGSYDEQFFGVSSRNDW